MEEKKESYFGEVGSALKTLATGLKVTMKEYFTKVDRAVSRES